MAGENDVRLMLALMLLAGSAVHGDDLRVKGLPGTLTWKNTPVSADVRGDALQIVAGPSTDWYISPLDGKVSANAPVLLFEPAADFVLTAKVAVEFETKWDAGTLMVYVNDTTWAKFALEMSAYQQPTIVTVVTRGVSDDCNSATVDGNSLWMRVAKTGGMIGFYSSADGKAWRLVRAFTLGETKGLRVGFTAQSPVGKRGAATFTGISYSPRKIKDVFTGE